MRFATSSFDAGVSGGGELGAQQEGRRKDDDGGGLEEINKVLIQFKSIYLGP